MKLNALVILQLLLMFSKIIVWSLKSTSIKWPKWGYNQSAQLLKDIASSSFNSLLCLGYDIFEVGVHFTPLASWTPSGMQRGELHGKLTFRWRNDFFKNSLNLISLCKIKNCCFHELCITFTLCTMLLNSNGNLIFQKSWRLKQELLIRKSDLL